MTGEARATDDPALQAPVLTFPPEESEIVRTLYSSANVILEYGSGGSTVLAAQSTAKAVFSVESDRDWTDNLQKYLDWHHPGSKVRLHHVDIGPTKQWGWPQTEAAWRQFHHYPISVWDRNDFTHPDVVLIDGRFRPACFVTTALRITKPVIVLWDDYLDRDIYHEIERWVKPTSYHGRMARFDLTPRTLESSDFSWVMKQFTRLL